MADVCMVFFQSKDCDLDAAERFLGRYGFITTREGERLNLSRANDPKYSVIRVTEPFVATEAAEIGDGTDHAKGLLKCDARFEILIEDLDAALNEINTLMEVQGALQDASHGYLFTPWNGNVSEPWEE